MKVVCDTCGTKYSIDDSRVSGKAFKIRCKTCDRVIVLRGKTAPVTEPVPEGAWHVVIDGTHRPIALAELHRLRADGELDDATLVWREGWTDWRELGTIDELRDVAPSIEVAPEAEPEAAAAGGSVLRPVLRPVLRNERNESSVLFSLGSLAKLAAPAPAAAAPAAAGEGSGLLDIRSIARTLAPAAARARTERGSLDDLPVYGPVTFGEPAVLVPAKPRGRDLRLVWALAASMGVLAIVTTILLVVVTRDGGPAHADGLPAATPGQPADPATPAAPAARSGSAPAAATELAPAAPMAAAPSAAQAVPAEAAPSVALAAAATPSVAQAAAPSVAGAAPTGAARSAAQAAPAPAAPPVRTASAASRRTPAHASSAQPVVPATPPALQPQRVAESCSEVTCIVNSYADKCCEIYREHADSHVAPPPGPALPEGLDRPAIAAGLSRIDTRGCRDQSQAHGDVTVSIKVSPAGAVTAVTVRSSPDPALSACVNAAARKATFGQTQRGGSFAYVWRF